MSPFADYDYYWYQDDDGNWRNEYDDYGYEFDPDRYEGDEADTANDTTKAKSSDEASTGTVIPSSKHDDLDKQMVPPPNDHLSTPSPGNDFFLLFFQNMYPGLLSKFPKYIKFVPKTSKKYAITTDLRKAQKTYV